MDYSAAVPLTDALPWIGPPQAPRTFLVGDTIDSDGSFLLRALASQVLQQQQQQQQQLQLQPQEQLQPKKEQLQRQRRRGRVFWLAGGPWTETLIAMALKRFGCEAAAIYFRNRQQQQQQQQQQQPLNTKERKEVSKLEKDCYAGSLSILSLTGMLSQIFQGDDSKEESCVDDSSSSWDGAEVCLKQVYRRLQIWSRPNSTRQQQQQQHDNNNNDDEDDYNSWIILDDLSSMANLLGQRVVYRFVHAVRALASREKLGLIMRCSWDGINMISSSSSTLSNTHNNAVIGGEGGGVKMMATNTFHNDNFFFGAGSSIAAAPLVVWEHGLVELADGIIQVVPLPSGFSRHAHGRLICTTRPDGRGWGLRQAKLPTKATIIMTKKSATTTTTAAGAAGSSSIHSVVVLNYILTETTVMAIRIRS